MFEGIMGKRVAWLCDFDPFQYNGGAELSDRAIIRHFNTRGGEVVVVTPELYDSFLGMTGTFDIIVLSNISRFPPSVYDTQNVVKYEHDCGWCKYRDMRCDVNDCDRCWNGELHPQFYYYRRMLELGALVSFYGSRHLDACKRAMGGAVNNHFKFVQPIDMTKFYDMGLERKDRAIFLGSNFAHKRIDLIDEWSQETGIPVDKFGRGFESGIIPHQQIPRLLNGYKYYVHFPEYPFAQTSRSLLEAYYCGCELITTDEYRPPNEMYISRQEMARQSEVFWDAVTKFMRDKDVLEI